MSTKKKHPNAKDANKPGPVIPGSVLYRALQEVARAVAAKLVSQAETNVEPKEVEVATRVSDKPKEKHKSQKN